MGTYDFDEPVHSVDSPFDNPSLFAASGEDGTVQVIDVRTPTGQRKFFFTILRMFYLIISSLT